MHAYWRCVGPAGSQVFAQGGAPSSQHVKTAVREPAQPNPLQSLGERMTFKDTFRDK